MPLIYPCNDYIFSKDVVVSCVLAGGHFAGGVLQAFYGKEWDDSIYDDVDDAQTIKKSMIASAVSD